MNTATGHDENVRKTVEAYWKTIPPLWQYVRHSVHRIAKEEFGITYSQYHVLRRIWKGGNSVSELSDCMSVSRPNISRAVDELVNEGLAQRERDAKDRRVVYLSLTEKGNELITQLHAENHTFMDDLFSDFTDEELNEMTSAFLRLEKIMVDINQD
jgi:DNA-binding MarR family transcriptional regulator